MGVAPQPPHMPATWAYIMLTKRILALCIVAVGATFAGSAPAQECGPFFFLWNPWWLGLFMLAYAVIANIDVKHSKVKKKRMLGLFASPLLIEL